MHLEAKLKVASKSYGSFYRVKLVNGPLDGEVYQTRSEPKEFLVLRSVPKMEEIFYISKYVLRAATENDYIFLKVKLFSK